MNQSLVCPIKKLNLSRNNIGPKGMQLLSESLRDNLYLKLLNISHNHIGDEGALGVSKILNSHNKKVGGLQELKVHSNGI